MKEEDMQSVEELNDEIYKWMKGEKKCPWT